MSNQLNVSVLVAARDEYSDQLKRHLQPLIQEGFNSIYEDSVVENNNNPLRQFQIFLKQIPNWNQSILDQETTRIKNKCPYLMDMVTAIFVSHVKILASVRLGGKHSNIKIRIPTMEIFIHSVYVASAECFYYDPEMFDSRHNTDKIKNIIYKNIDSTISSMIPIQSILQEYLCNTFTEHVNPIKKEIIEEKEELGDILSGNDILDNLDMDNNNIDGGYESDKSDLSGLFTNDNSGNDNTIVSDNDPIFPIGDTAPFEDKMNFSNYDDDIKLDDINLDDINLDMGDVKTIPPDNFLGDDQVKYNKEEITLPTFNEDIPIDQDNFGFNDSNDGAMENDFNFFDNNDIL